MSVQKFIIAERKISFTTVPNKVLQGLRDFEALGLYCYLASLPPNWVFYKNEIRDHARIGIHKLNNLLKTLEISKLIITAQIREKGRFSHFLMNVLDGNDFEINELSPCYKNRNTVTVLRKSASINNTTQNDTKKKKQREGKVKKFNLSDFFNPDFDLDGFIKNTPVLQRCARANIDPSFALEKFLNHREQKGFKSFSENQLNLWCLNEIDHKLNRGSIK